MTELSVLKSLLTSDDADVPSVWEEARLINRVKASIQTARENTVASWETAVISIRGWLAVFAAAAVLLLALSGQLATTPIAEKSDNASELVSSVNEASHELANSTTSASEELISKTAQNLPSDERGNLEE